MRRVRGLATVVLAALSVLACSSAPAWAGNGYESVTSRFGEPCGAHEVPCGPGKFKEPTSIAVNDETEDVYVLDSGNDRIEYFSFNATTKAHEYAGQFNGSGEDLAVEGKAAPTGKFLEPGDIAVDNDPLSPSHGDVYVADVGHDAIDKFSATGKYEGQLTGGKCENEEEAPPCAEGKVISNKVVPFSGLLDVAVDPSGNVWVFEANAAEVYEFSDTGGRFFDEATYSIGEGHGFAVDSSGDVYVTTEVGRIDEFAGGGRVIISENVSPLGTLAIISSTNDLLVDEGSSVELFSRASIESGGTYSVPTIRPRVFAGGELSESQGIAVNGASGEGTIYATQRGADDVDVFEPGAAEAPEIVSESAASTSTFDGEFSAVIDPENSATTYSFEYSTSKATVEKGEGTSIPGEAELPAEFGQQTVTSREVSFSPYNKTFYYRVIATNKLGTVKGDVNDYIKVPLVEKEKVSALASTSAKLEAEVNPDFLETAYRIEYATSEELLENGEGVLVGAGGLPEVGEPQQVSAEVRFLQPGATYYYRVVAENEVTEDRGEPVIGKITAFKTYAPPATITGAAQGITQSAATLSGEVDPEGTEVTYYFAYISETGFQHALANGATNPSAPDYREELAKGAPNPYAEGETTTPITVSASDAPQVTLPIPVGGLLPGTTYHFTLVAMSKFDIREIGDDRTFTTQSPTPPLVSTGGVSGVSQNSATLSGTVSTNGLQTNYGFEIGTEPGNYGPATGLGSIGGSQTETVAVTLGELQPGTTYYYRVTASNADGTSRGAPQSFTTPGFPVLIAPLASPPLIGTPSIAFPKEEKGTTGTTTKTLTNKEKLAKALKACKQDKKKAKRVACEKRAEKKYPTTKKKAKKRK